MYEKVETWFDIVDLEVKILAFWEKNKIFKKLVEKNKEKKIWSFLDGPITANNPMGVHHAWGRTLKDVYQRYWAMNDRKLRYQNGFDCQGLWVEVEVEKELDFKSKKDIEDYGIDKFIEKCKERVYRYSDIISGQSKRLGFWMDWDNSYYTMSDENNYTIWTFLKKCFERGLIYKGHDVMPWCPRCGTGISQHEMQEDYQETKHLAVIISFPIRDREKEAFLVWTTTPWTLTSNVAIAVNPDLIYVKVKQGDWIYYIVKEQADIVLKKDNEWKVIEKLTGSDILNSEFLYEGPFDELPAQKEARLQHRVIPWLDVKETEGTGIVHIAPGCGAEDFMLGKEFNLPVIAPLEENGLFSEGYDWLSGKYASEVGEDIKRNLKEKKILYSSEKYLHSYPHCWRCNTELLFRLVDEWFIRMDPWREEIKEVAKKIKWIPSFGMELELDWLNNMRDWMISKKRYWGLALPIWECKDCNNFTVIGSFEELEEKAVSGLEQVKEHSPHRPWIDKVIIECSTCGKKISRIPDVGNPWLDAGIVPYSTVKYNSDRDYWNKWMPADIVLECFPGQFRNWFYSLLAMSTMMENIPPFKTLVGHAMVRDENGEEMHKSKGNAIWFDDAAEKIGVEVMRWMFCTHELVSNLNFGYNAAKLVRGKFINTLWNSYAFFVNYARLIDFKVSKNPPDISLRSDFDRWILSKLQELVAKCRKGFEEYDVRTAARGIDEFLEILSNWYIRNNRRRFWRSEMDEDTISAYETLFEVLYKVLRLLAPMLPILTEKIYQNMVRIADPTQPESIHLTHYPFANEGIIDEQLVQDMDNIIKLNTLALSAREKSKIKIRQPLSTFIFAPNSDMEARAVNRFSNLLKGELNVKEIKILDVKAPCPMKLQVRPGKKSLGQKYRAKSKLIAEKIEEQVDSITRELEKSPGSWEMKLHVEGEAFTITREDLLIEEINPENLSIVRFYEGWVAFDTLLTEELLLEGLMREFLRKMQVLRKDTGLEIENRILISYKTDSSKIKMLIDKYKKFICDELLCLEIKEDNALVSDHKLNISKEEMSVAVEKV